MARPASCFFVHLGPMDMVSFTRHDYEILQTRYRTERYCYRGTKGGLLDIPRIFWGVLTSNFSLSWFAYEQAYWAVRFAKALGRPSIVVVGGFDVCEEEDPRLASRLARVRFTLEHATSSLPVSERVAAKCRNLVPKGRVFEVLHHGFDAELYYPSGPKAPIAITVGYLSEQNLRRKGVDVFVDAAHLLPDVSFVVVGELRDRAAAALRDSAPSNVAFTGKIPEQKLVRWLQRASVYVQPSYHEGFGCSIAEAMLCGCVPVVTDRGAIPEVVGDAGVYVRPGDARSVADGISRALVSEDLRERARMRIMSLFPIQRRRERLLAISDDVLVPGHGQALSGSQTSGTY